MTRHKQSAKVHHEEPDKEPVVHQAISSKHGDKYKAQKSASRKRRNLAISIAIGVIVALATTVVFVMKSTALPLKEEHFYLHPTDGSDVVWRAMIKVPETFQGQSGYGNGHNDLYGGTMTETPKTEAEAYGSAYISYEMANRADYMYAGYKSSGQDFRKDVDEKIKDSLESLCEENEALSSFNVKWRASLGQSREYKYKDMDAYVVSIDCVVARDNTDARVNAGDAFIYTAFVAQQPKEKPMQAAKAFLVQIHAPKNHPVQSARQQIFDSLTVEDAR